MTSVGVMASSVNAGGAIDVLAEPFDNFTAAPWTTAGIPTIVAGRTGTAASFNGTSATATYAISAPNQSPYVTAGCAFRTTSTTLTRYMMQFHVSGVLENGFVLFSDGSIRFYRGSTSIAISGASGLVAINTWYYIEVQYLNDPTVGWVVARLNGTTVLNVTGLNTRVNGSPNELRLLAASSTTQLYDDLYLSTGAGVTFKGDHTIP